MPVRDLDESSVSCSMVTRLALSTGGREEGSMAAMATVVFLYSCAKLVETQSIHSVFDRVTEMKEA